MQQNQFTDSDIWQYCLEHTQALSPKLQSLIKDTQINVHGSQMLSEKIVTKILQLLVFTTNAKLCVDVGTYTGLSALAMAEVTSDDAVIYTIDKKNQAGNGLAQSYFQDEPKIKYIIGDAVDVIPTLPNNIDIAFIDADKVQTKSYFDILINKLSDRGVIIVDDILWRGEVLNPNDKRAKALDEFNKYIMSRGDLDNVVLPIRHGINLIRKI
ncbi:O-methyltransferase [Pseudofrancisella aestuarii]|uniref:O-methyltransferase n=1 Tax=Pseudofrancisella aestuarii TaxID=2670347 RepID=A0ABV9TB52_9GAMM|nr:class I SAM-dependent methyltransferase [Pseudofrancisella aestuarii]